MPTSAAPSPHLQALRRQIARLERNHAQLGQGGGALRHSSQPLGVTSIDSRLPGGGLPTGALHLIEGLRGEWDDGAATGFCLSLIAQLMAKRPGRVLWVSPWRDLHFPGLASQGLDPERFLFAHVRDKTDLLWTLEEALTCQDLVAVGGELEVLPRRAARRLQLAAEASGVTLFLLSRGLRQTRRGREIGDASTAWAVGSQREVNFNSTKERDRKIKPLLPKNDWKVELRRCRGAVPGAWRLGWKEDGRLYEKNAEEAENHATNALSMASAFRPRIISSQGNSPGAA